MAKCHWCDAPAAVFAAGENLGLGAEKFVPRSTLSFCEEHMNEQRSTDLIDGKGWSAMTTGWLDEPSTSPQATASDRDA